MSKGACAIFVCIFLGAGAGCALPPLALSTPQPINVNIAMKLDVYQHGQPSAEKKAAATNPGTAEALQDRRRLRLGELQPLKNSRLIGETHLGLLEVRTSTPGEYGDYVRQTIAAENNDRIALMDMLAKTQKIPLPEVQKQLADNAAHSAFNGEWVEIQKTDGSYVWTQKGKE